MQHKPHSTASPNQQATFEEWLPNHPTSVDTFNVEQPNNISMYLSKPDVEASNINSLWAEQFYTYSFKDKNSISWGS